MIYLVEDDESIRELVIYTLKSQGMEAKGFERPSLFWKELEKETSNPAGQAKTYPQDFNNQSNNHSKAIISNHFNTFSSQSVSLHFPL